MKYSRFLVVAILVASQIACADDSSTTAPSETTAPSPIYVVTPTTLSLGIGDSTQIRVVVTGSDNTQRLVTTSATWASANTTVATVTSDGVVTARATGTAVITVTVSEGTATVTVTVSNESQPMTFVGAAAGPGTETATLRFTANSPPRLTGTAYFRQAVVSLIGRVDEQTQVVDLGGGGFRFLGVIRGNVLTGAYFDPLGLTGGFTAIDATHTAVTAFCGSYTSDGSTVLGNTDSGAMVLAVSSDGTAAASALAADASLAPQTFAGSTSGGELSLVSNTGETVEGRLQGETATGVFHMSGRSSAMFSISSSACH